MFRSDGEETSRLQVSEVKILPAGLLYQQDIKNVRTAIHRSASSWENHAEAFIVVNVPNENSAASGISDVTEKAANGIKSLREISSSLHEAVTAFIIFHN